MVKKKADFRCRQKHRMMTSALKIGRENRSLAHHFFWAPFVLVGEGE
jgi:CHAT domain-containing protein